MSRRALAAAAAGVLLLGACGGDDSGDGAGDEIEIRQPWSRWTAAGTSVGSIYAEIESPRDDTLTGVTVDPTVAGASMLHLTVEADDMTSMEHTDGIDLPAGETVALEPNGSHLMLEDLTVALEEGTSFEATFEFAGGPDQTVTVDVLADAP